MQSEVGMCALCGGRNACFGRAAKSCLRENLPMVLRYYAGQLPCRKGMLGHVMDMCTLLYAWHIDDSFSRTKRF